MPSGDEKALLEKARQSDPAALGEIYDRYAVKIYSYILYQVGEQGLAEDLTASVFIKMLDAIKASKAWRLSFSSWLYRIAHNAVVDHFRRSSHFRSLPLDEGLVASKDSPSATVETVMATEVVKEAMGQLTVEQRTVVILKFFEECSNLEVATIMNKTEGAVKSLQYRALAALRRQLGGD